MAWVLCSKSDVQAITPISEGELQEFWSNTVEALIRQHMNNPNLGTSEVIVAELHSGDGNTILQVRKPPIISVQAVRVSDYAYTAADYAVFTNYIQMKNGIVFPEGTLNVEADYTSGETEVPFDVQLTAAAMIVAIINYKGRMGADSSLKWGTGEKVAGEDTPNANIGLTSHLSTIMRRMLRRDNLMVR